MLIIFDGNGIFKGHIGYRNHYNDAMIDELSSPEEHNYLRIYDAETIDRVWSALDTGGTVRIEFDNEGEPIVITENGDLEPPTDEPSEPEPTPIELLQQENEILKAQNKATSERADFMEDLIAEMAIQVYS